MNVNTMLIATDFSEASIWAANHAAEYARKLNYAVDLVHVIDPSHIDKNPLVAEDPPEEVIDKIAEKLRSDYGVTVDTLICEGKPGKVVPKLSQSQKYTMVAVGYSGRSGILTRIGSVASKVVRLVDKPILVLVPNHFSDGPVIGCIDFSDGTEKINYWTHCLANISGAEPVFAHVAVPFEVIISAIPPFGGMVMTESVMIRLGTSESEYRSRLEGSVRERLGVGTKGRVEILLDHFPAMAIGKFAADQSASLVVMGRHGHNTLGARVMGTTSEQVLGLSECSTLVIP